MDYKRETIVIKNAQLWFPNFSGEATDFTTVGDRYVHVVIDKELADAFLERGGNVKERINKSTEEVFYTIKLSIKYRDRSGNLKPISLQPKIFMVNHKGPVRLSEERVGVLDNVFLTKVDLSFNVGSYEDRKTHENKIAFYLNELYATIEESELEKDYSQYDGPNPDLPFEVN